MKKGELTQLIEVRRVLEKLLTDSLQCYIAQPLSGEERYALTRDKFAETKLGIQTAVAEAFQASMSDFSGVKVPYECIITATDKRRNLA